MKKLSGRVAVVTGGSRGIGREMCKYFAKEGCNIVFTYRSNEDEARQTVEDVKSTGAEVFAVKADVSKEEEILELRNFIEKQYGKINILVNNAGICSDEVPVTEMEAAEWDEIINVDLRGVFLLCKYLIPIMEKEPVGKIVNISSELALKGRANLVHYTAAKGAVIAFTKSLALELAPDILVNCIAPGPVATDMILSCEDQDWIENEKNIPLGRLGTTEELAATALLLVSDEGNFFCGQVISPNGGAVM